MIETIEFSSEELKAIREEYCKGASDSQFQNFIREARIRNLIPGKHLHFQLRNVKEYDDTLHTSTWIKRAIHLTAIDFFRLTAQRTGEYRGQKRPVWIYLDDQNSPTVRSEVPLPNKVPYAAEASVLRKNFEEPITTIARFDAYAVYYKEGNGFKLNSVWEKRGPEQLYKCSEAQALRQAFPEELSGLYIEEEIRDENPEAAAVEISSALQAEAPSVPGPPSPGVPKAIIPPELAPFDTFPTASELAKTADNISGLTDILNFPTKEERTAYVNRLRYFMKNLLPKAGVQNADEVLKAYVKRFTGKKSTKDYTKTEWESLLGFLDTAKDNGTLKQLVEGHAKEF